MSGGTGSPPGGGQPMGRPAASSSSARDTGSTTRKRLASARGALARVGAVTGSVGDTFVAHFGIDARALAAFRIALGGTLLANLLLRARHLTAFHTDAGIYPRSVLADTSPLAAEISIFAQFGSTEAQIVLFAIAGIAAVALACGYRSSLAAIVSFVLLVSLNRRNPVVLTGGDFLLRHLLFWAILLPVSERWSVDAIRRDRTPREWIASLATAGLLLQVVVVYTINAVHKHRGSTWGEGLAMQYVFQLDHVTVYLGDYVAEITPLIVALDYAWFWMVTLSVLLVILRGWPRAAFASLFVGAHVSMFVTIQIGTFALVSIASLLVFYPTPVWDRVERAVARPLSASLAGLRDALEKRQPTPTIPRPSWSGRVVGGWRLLVVPLVAALAISSITVGNAAAVHSGDSARWSMFAPDPWQESVWVTMGGTTASGDTVDAFPFREANVTADRPPDMADTYPSVRWGRYYQVVANGDPRLQTSLADYVCRRWNATHDDPLLDVSVTHHIERVVLDGPNPRRTNTMIEYDCTTGSRVLAR